ncbi:MAG: lipoyl(octanoyl) transferase LipB [Desulfosarcinaceae bacterium]|nr:lipoyl(octanoyl) transferase LipB [Desulfosarcinaceae bacterium]
MTHPALLLDLPRLAYGEALDLMRALVAAKVAHHLPEILILLEHEPVLTMGRRSAEGDLKVSRACLQEQGIDLHQVERGGLLTYHGPGQLVAYPLLDLKRLKLGVVDLVGGLEAAIITTLAAFQVEARRIAGQRGVYVGGDKIASVGIAVKRSVSYHGLALNCEPNLGHFDLITPCGLSGVRMTSMADRLGRSVPTAKVRPVLVDALAGQFGLSLESVQMDQLRDLLQDGIGPGAAQVTWADDR